MKRFLQTSLVLFGTLSMVLAMAGCSNPLLQKALGTRSLAESPVITVALADGTTLKNGDVLDFGSLAYGTGKDIVLMMGNSGKSTLTIAADGLKINATAEGDSERFALVVPAAMSLAPGSSATVTLRLGADASGDKRAELLIASNDVGTPRFGLSLKGTVATQQAVAALVFTPTAGTYDKDQSVSISCTTEGAVIRYTTDGSDPMDSSPVFDAAKPISVAGHGTSVTIKAKAAKPNYLSASANATIGINYNKVSTPQFNPPAGSYVDVQTVTLTCSTSNSTILYTIDGSDPATSTTGVTYGGAPINVGSTTTIKALAKAAGLQDSSQGEAVYTINGRVATPASSVAELPSGYTMAQSVTLSCATPGATIRYKTDGTSPSATVGTVYAGETIVVPVGGISRIRAIAYRSNFLDSLIYSADIKVKPATCTKPTALVQSPDSFQASISWTAAAGAQTYDLGRGTLSDGSDRSVITSGVSALSAKDPTAKQSPNSYYYWVRAVSEGGIGDWSPVSAKVSPLAYSTQWARTVSSANSNSTVFAVAADISDQSIYAALYLDAGGSGFPATISYDFGGKSFSLAKSAVSGKSIPALIKYNSDGSVAWVIYLSACAPVTAECRFTGVSVNSSTQNITVVGTSYWASGTFTFTGTAGTKTMTTSTTKSGFVMQVSATGVINWITPMGGTSVSQFRDIAADAAGNTYAVGSQSNAGLIVKFGSTGTQAASIAVAGVDSIAKVVVDTSGNLYCTGNNPITTYNHAVVKKFNPSLVEQWSTPALVSGFANSSLYPDGLRVNGSTVYVAYTSYGSSSQTTNVDWNSGKLTSYLGSRPFLATYDAISGTTILAKTLAVDGSAFPASSSNDYGGIAISSDSDGAMYIATSANGGSMIDFGNGVTVTPLYGSYGNSILVKFDASGNAIWAQSTVSANTYSNFYDVVNTGNDELIAVGCWENTGSNTVGFGNANSVSGGYVESWPATGKNLLIVKYGCH